MTPQLHKKGEKKKRGWGRELTLAEGLLGTACLHVHQTTSVLRKPLNSKTHLTLHFPELKVLKLAQKFIFWTQKKA